MIIKTLALNASKLLVLATLINLDAFQRKLMQGLTRFFLRALLVIVVLLSTATCTPVGRTERELTKTSASVLESASLRQKRDTDHIQLTRGEHCEFF